VIDPRPATYREKAALVVVLGVLYGAVLGGGYLFLTALSGY
jgi:hypothetical protein